MILMKELFLFFILITWTLAETEPNKVFQKIEMIIDPEPDTFCDASSCTITDVCSNANGGYCVSSRDDCKGPVGPGCIGQGCMCCLSCGPGGWCPGDDNAGVHKMLVRLKPQIAHKLGYTPKHLWVQCYIYQVVAGFNYDVQVKIDADHCIRVEFYQDPANKLTLQGVQDHVVC